MPPSFRAFCISRIFSAAERVTERAAVSSYRSMYSEVAKLLVRFMSAFGRRAAEKLTAELRGRYEHRPAFIEELDKAGL